MEVILHIGSTKTGSSALQRFLSQHRKKLQKEGFTYPEVGSFSSAHHLIAAIFHPSAMSMHKGQVKPADRVKFVKELRALNAKKLILSSEYFWSSNKHHKVRLINFLKECGAKKISIVVYVREYCDWLQSQYNQAVKSGAVGDFTFWSEKLFVKPNGYHNYLKNLAHWEDLELYEIVVRPYDEKYVTDINADFLNYLGLDVKEFEIKKSQINPSPGTSEIELLAILNEVDVPIKDKQKIKDFLMNIGKPRFLFQDFQHMSKDDFRRIKTFVGEDMLKFKNKYFSDSEFMPLKSDSQFRDFEDKHKDQMQTMLKMLIGLSR